MANSLKRDFKRETGLDNTERSLDEDRELDRVWQSAQQHKLQAVSLGS